MKIFIIILTYGDISVTKECVRSICEIDPAYTKIIIVNNNAQDITPATFGKFKEEIYVINNRKNLGFAGGVNKGIEKAVSLGADYVLLLNNDTVLEHPIIEGLVSFGEETKKAGIIAPAIRFKKEGKTWFDLGGNINAYFGRTQHTEVTKVTDIKARKVQYVSGCCMLIKTEVYQAIGGLDEAFFLYYEDVDYCLRARTKGYYSYLLPSIVVPHALSKTIGKVSPLALYHQTRSALIFGKKYYQKTYGVHLFFVIVQCGVFMLRDIKNSWYAWKALYDYFFITHS